MLVDFFCFDIKTIKKTIYLLLLLLLVCMPNIASADIRVEERVGQLLVEEFEPESLLVQATEGGSFLYAKAKGVVLEGMRVDSISVFAMMKEPPHNISGKDVYELADLIHMARAEVVLLKKDVDGYCSTAVEDVKGFTNLEVDFSSDKITVNGTYTAKFLFTFNIRMMAKAKLGFINGDFSLVDTVFCKRHETVGIFDRKVLKEINPLIKREKIPFPVNINNIVVTEDKIVVTGRPKPLQGDSLRVWKYAKN